MEDLIFEDEYQEVTRPNRLFKDLEEVKKFCENADIMDLKFFREACDIEELYEYSNYITKLIKTKQSKG